MNRSDVLHFLTQVQDACTHYLSPKNVNAISEILRAKTIRLPKNLKTYNVEGFDEKAKACGIYAFFIRPKKTIETLDSFRDLWEKIPYSPRIIAKRCKVKNKFQRLEKGELRCLYVGKSEKDLAHRIQQHIHQTQAQSTYGLKLSQHTRIFSAATIEYSCFNLEFIRNPDFDDALKCFLVTLESRLRDREDLKPLIGKQ